MEQSFYDMTAHIKEECGAETWLYTYSNMVNKSMQKFVEGLFCVDYPQWIITFRLYADALEEIAKRELGEKDYETVAKMLEPKTVTRIVTMK